MVVVIPTPVVGTTPQMVMLTSYHRLATPPQMKR
jgi:hypothetical protein